MIEPIAPSNILQRLRAHPNIRHAFDAEDLAVRCGLCGALNITGQAFYIVQMPTLAVCDGCARGVILGSEEEL